jgi:hypothetical protein
MTSPVAVTIGPAGISAPNFPTILAYYVGQYQAIYGADSYLGNDSQDGQLIGIFSAGINDCNSAVIAAYQSRSPTEAQGVGLASVVKINGLKVIIGSFSTVLLTVVGVAGTVINNGQAQDNTGNFWALPPTVTIPNSGTINVTASCTQLGPFTASAISTIATPTLNWQSVSIASGASISLGASTETDAALRVRQSNSTALPSVGIFDGIFAAIEQVAGVTRATAYENDTNSTNGNGIPATTLCFVVECPVGVQAAVAQAIALKKPPGTATYGNVATTVVSAKGTVTIINQQTPSESTFVAAISVHTLNGWATSTEALIISAVSAYFASVPIGGVVNIASVITAAQLIGTAQAPTFLVKAVTVTKNSGSPQSTDFTLTFAEAATPGVSTVALV